MLVCGLSAADEQMAASDKLRMVYFSSSSCPDCQRVKAFLPQVLAPWSDHIALELQSVDDISVFKKLFAYEKHYAVEVNAPPAIFIGDKALIGEKVIMAGLEEAVIGALSDDIETFKPERAKSEAEEPLAVAGINPANDAVTVAESGQRSQFIVAIVLVMVVLTAAAVGLRAVMNKAQN